MSLKAFVYCWTDHKTNKLYIGSHKGTENDGYICSSKSMLKEYNVRPTDFTRQIIATGNLKDIRKLESKLLKAVNARLNEDFYNKHENDGFYFEGWKKGEFSDEHRKNMSIAAKNRKRTKEHLQKLHEGRKKSKNSKSHIQSIKKAYKERIESGYYKTEEYSKVMSEARLKIDPQKRCEIARRAGEESQRKRKIKKEGIVNGD